MSASLKIGVIGLGRMGQLYARTLVTQVTGVQLYAVAEPVEQLTAHARTLEATPKDSPAMAALERVRATVVPMAQAKSPPS